MNDDMQVLVPNHELTINGETIVVKPFAFTQLPKASALIAKHLKHLEGGRDSLNVVNLITEGGEDVFQLMCMSAGIPRTTLDTFDAEQGMDLLLEVVEVNFDFFTQKVLPAIQRAMARLDLKLQLPGEK